MSGLRILQIAHDHPDWTRGGTEILAHGLTRALDDRPGVSARFLAASTALQRPEGAPGALGVQGRDLTLHTGAYDRFGMTRLDGTGWLAALAAVVARLRPEVIHLHGLDRIGAESVLALRRLAPQARVVLTLHDYQLICANDGLTLGRDGARCACARGGACVPELGAARHALRRAHLLALLENVDAFLAPSRFLRDRFVEWGIAAERIALLPNAVAPAPRAPERPRARRDRFAFFGNIAAHKGALVLLEAAALLREAGAELSLALHGGLTHPEPAFAEAFAAGLAAARPLARHLGAYAPAEVGRRMAEADWIVLPSVWPENAPLVALEARAAGRPVICSDIGGLPELVPDGIHVPPGDAAALAETMIAAAADPGLWARCAPAAPSDDYPAFVDAHLALYRRLLQRVAA